MSNDLDRAIDAAATRMVAGEPSRALTYAVMARVREREAPSPRRLVWTVAAASLVLCGAIAVSLMNRATPIAFPAAPPAHVLAVAPSLVAVSSIAVAEETTTRRRNQTVARAAASTSSAPLPIADNPIDPIETAAISVSVIDVPQLERETTEIEILDIEPLTIEPLAASND